MSWNVSTDESDEVGLVHDDGYRLEARKIDDRSPEAEWQFEVADTVNGQVLLKIARRVPDDDGLWALLDDYAERYPPR